MAVRYLKKKKLYELACKLIQEPIETKMTHCTYRFRNGFEWISFCTKDKIINISSCLLANGSQWISISVHDDEYNKIYEKIICDSKENIQNMEVAIC